MLQMKNYQEISIGILCYRKKMPAEIQSKAGQGVACLPGRSTLGRAIVDGNLTCSVTEKTIGVLPLVSTYISLS